MSTQYTVDYFISKFEAIPEERWCVKDFVDGDKCCALGHCGMRFERGTPEGYELNSIFYSHDLILIHINDGLDPGFPQPTPKQRILAALREIKAKRAK